MKRVKPFTHSSDITISTIVIRKRILVVDDEPAVCDMVKWMLEIDAHIVETALNGRDAFIKFESGDFDLVVADYLMPEMKGDQLAIALKRHPKRPPIILISGDPPRSPTREIDFVLTKPFSLVDLRLALEAVAELRAA